MPCPVPSSGEITLAANIEIDPPALKAALEGHCPEAAVRYVTTPMPLRWASFGAAVPRVATSMVMVTIGTGLGGGVVVNGDVIGGAFGAGGEIGHITVNPDETETCGCGRRGLP